MQLDGRTAIVTGAGNGSGIAIASAFVAHGAPELIFERNEKTVSASFHELVAVAPENQWLSLGPELPDA